MLRYACTIVIAVLLMPIQGFAQQSYIHESRYVTFGSKLVDAADRGQRLDVLSYLKAGYNPNERGDFDTTALMRAAYNNHLKVADLLLSMGADPNSVDLGGASPLHLASRQGYTEMAKLLVEHGATVDIRDVEGWTPLLRSVQSKTPKLVEFFIEKKANLFEENEWEQNPLTLAAQNGSVPVMEALFSGDPKFFMETLTPEQQEKLTTIARELHQNEMLKYLEKTRTDYIETLRASEEAEKAAKISEEITRNTPSNMEKFQKELQVDKIKNALNFLQRPFAKALDTIKGTPKEEKKEAVPEELPAEEMNAEMMDTPQEVPTPEMKKAMDQAQNEIEQHKILQKEAASKYKPAPVLEKLPEVSGTISPEKSEFKVEVKEAPKVRPITQEMPKLEEIETPKTEEMPEIPAEVPDEAPMTMSEHTPSAEMMPAALPETARVVEDMPWLAAKTELKAPEALPAPAPQADEIEAVSVAESAPETESTPWPTARTNFNTDKKVTSFFAEENPELAMKAIMNHAVEDAYGKNARKKQEESPSKPVEATHLTAESVVPTPKPAAAAEPPAVKLATMPDRVHPLLQEEMKENETELFEAPALTKDEFDQMAANEDLTIGGTEKTIPKEMLFTPTPEIHPVLLKELEEHKRALEPTPAILYADNAMPWKRNAANESPKHNATEVVLTPAELPNTETSNAVPTQNVDMNSLMPPVKEAPPITHPAPVSPLSEAPKEATEKPDFFVAEAVRIPSKRQYYTNLAERKPSIREQHWIQVSGFKGKQSMQRYLKKVESDATLSNYRTQPLSSKKVTSPTFRIGPINSHSTARSLCKQIVRQHGKANCAVSSKAMNAR